MDLKARVSKGYQWRIGFVALLMAGFSCWFCYDAVVKYPAMRRAYETYQQVKDEHGDGPHWAAWQPIAEANGWKPETPPSKKTRFDINLQYACGALTAAVALFFAVSFARMYTRWVAADAEGVFDSKGRRVAWSDIDKVDKTRWKTKGIAVVRYRDGKAEHKIVLDDWKFDQEPINGIVARVDAHVDAEKIEQPASPAGDDPKIANDVAAAEPGEADDATRRDA